MESVAARMVFENAKMAIKNAFPKSPDILNRVKLTQSYLRLEQLIAANVTQYQFPILVNDTSVSAIFNTEQRLNLQDSFVTSQLGFFVAAPASTADAAYRLQTYPNQIIFGAAAANAMRVLYNSSLKLTINNDVLIPAWDTFRHLYQPETQQTAALGAGSPDDQVSGFNSFYPVEPNIVLIGSKNNVLNLVLPAAVASVLASSRIVIIIRGVLAQNSTVVS